MSELKLSDRLEELALSQNDPSVCSDIQTIAQEAMALESTNAELTKRVAELGSIVADINPERNVLALLGAWQNEIMTLRAQIADLQSQLAWTPVSAGLPTEDGDYHFVFLDAPRILRASDVLTLSARGWSASPTNCDYTHYRRIELPEAT